MSHGKVGWTLDIDKGGERDGEEALMLDVIKFHRSECLFLLRVTIVRSPLVEDDAIFRTSGKVLDTLREHVGPKAIDQTIPTLLETLRQPDESSGTALQALRQVMSVSHGS